eukprot:50262_1
MTPFSAFYECNPCWYSLCLITHNCIMALLADISEFDCYTFHRSKEYKEMFGSLDFDILLSHGYIERVGTTWKLTSSAKLSEKLLKRSVSALHFDFGDENTNNLDEAKDRNDDDNVLKSASSHTLDKDGNDEGHSNCNAPSHTLNKEGCDDEQENTSLDTLSESNAQTLHTILHGNDDDDQSLIQ